MMKPGISRQVCSRISLFFVAVALAVIATNLAHAVASADDEYLKILALIERADTANANTNAALAKTKYEEAYTALTNFKKSYPLSNTKAVTFRLKYVTDKLTSLAPESAPPPGSDSTPKSDVQSLPKAAPLPAGMQLKLVAAGSAPRKAFRFQSKAGDKQAAVITMSSSMSMGMGDAAAETMKLPSMKIIASATTKAVSPEADIELETVIEDVIIEAAEGIPPEMKQEMEKATKVLKGLRVVSTMSDRGLVKKAEPQLAPDTDAATRQVIEQIKTSFAETELLLPHEPIGPGAKWEVRQKLKDEGMAIDQVSTVTLVSAEGDVLNLKNVIAQSAANQKVPHPLVPGTTATLVKLTGNGTGTAKFDLSKLMPLESNQEEHTTTVLSAEVAGQKQTATIKNDSTIRAESK
jgi:hypothetical protein